VRLAKKEREEAMSEVRALQGAILALAIFIAAGHAAAQQNVRILAPSVDTCRAFTVAMDANNHAAVSALGGWALGFLSGVARGTGIDFLRKEEAPKLLERLYTDCLKQPGNTLSLTVEEMARAFLAKGGGIYSPIDANGPTGAISRSGLVIRASARSLQASQISGRSTL
jgi:hypothetical protein